MSFYSSKISERSVFGSLCVSTDGRRGVTVYE
jgi:hypothetical protein